MTKYVHFDPASTDPKPVFGWFDTDAVSYPSLPAKESLLEVTEDQWAQHMSDLRGEHFTIQSGNLKHEVLLPSPPSPSQNAQIAYDSFIAAGVRVTSKGTPDLGGTYIVDSESQEDISAVSQYIRNHGSFPPNYLSPSGEKIPWMTMDSATPKIFSNTSDFQNLAQAILSIITSARVARMLIAGGQPASMPDNSIIID